MHTFRGKKTVDKKKRRRKKEAGNGDTNMDDDNDDDNDEMEDMDVCEEDIQRLSLRNETDSTQNPSVPSTSNAGEVTQDVEMDVNPEEESVFKVTVGPQSAGSAEGGASGSAGSGHSSVFMPCPRMNALLSVVNGVLYLYGGMYEHGDRQYTFSDFYSLDIHKLDEWNTIIENNFKDQVGVFVLKRIFYIM